MIIKGIQEENFINYKKPSMFISFSSCTWKCEKECGRKVCQNGTLATTPNINIGVKTIVNKYINNPITKSIVIGGLEPMLQFSDVLELIKTFRNNDCNDDIVIYTGYYKEEIADKIALLSEYKNVVIKYGRYIPNQEKHYDEVLGVYLASDNQHAEKIS